ncbi:DUF503 domain-containing protein [Thermosipho atlanticus]|uniref:DUF503 domain-containing protein n=1 Tax=Thermosipho atlanticus DSM 15807 TaxID=1123380 RepID=A0A1M5RW38_9BACT|nr:DUF503 domain-containing protein [Thermosipho atlanticus]SHH30464.1 hypothetical protein SAMN02745199_0655 [Thermosipho atlanticus DSM 15807]
MPISYMEFSIKLFGINSLKEKRSIVKRLISDIRNKFNVSVIENDLQDSKSYINLALSFVSINKSAAYRTMENLEEYIEQFYNVENVIKEVYD